MTKCATPECWECGGRGVIESGRTCPTCWGRAMRGEDKPPVECAHRHREDHGDNIWCQACDTVWAILPAAQWADVKALPNKWRREAVSQCLMCCETSQQKADELEQVVKGEGNDGD